MLLLENVLKETKLPFHLYAKFRKWTGWKFKERQLYSQRSSCRERFGIHTRCQCLTKWKHRPHLQLSVPEGQLQTWNRTKSEKCWWKFCTWNWPQPIIFMIIIKKFSLHCHGSEIKPEILVIVDIIVDNVAIDCDKKGHTPSSLKVNTELVDAIRGSCVAAWKNKTDGGIPETLFSVVSVKTLLFIN